MNYAAYLKSLFDKDGIPSGDPFRLFQTLLSREELEGMSADYQAPGYSWYPETEFCYMTNKNGFFVATKGGYNNESHNHNDAGTFSLYLNTTPIFYRCRSRDLYPSDLQFRTLFNLDNAE